MEYDANKILSNFKDINHYNVSPYGNGHINDTYLCESPQKYILQKINTGIFAEPENVMENIDSVTSHLRRKIAEAGGDPSRETLEIIYTVDGKTVYKTEKGDYFRLYTYVGNTVTKETAETNRDLYSAARAFGKFQNMLADFPAEKLHETIPNFHNTKSRFADFKKAVENDACGRCADAAEEIELALGRESMTGTVVDLLENGGLPLRVTHNDTKLNNVLFDADTDEAICVIDLDTVMPGSLLYDYGDALRFGASSAAEDEKDLSKVYFDLDKFSAFTKGYLEELAPSITEKELELLPDAAMLMTYECGIRFLGDYLNGDTYFKTHYAEHNLVRARTQLKLVKDMESKKEEMKKIISDIMKTK
ncbi:MAG: aminoglycoside phosphotransferase family protein [Clostridia bacterium]|nr:aminoglycoside phosphotransferase family protein [Clostridia bacterium]